MKKLHLNAVREVESSSPRGRFRRARKELSIALGAEPGKPASAGGHPFEVELIRLPPGASNYPYHLHTAEHEFYLVVSGRAEVRTPTGITEVGPGEFFIFPPGEAHQLTNPGPDDFTCYVIADNPGRDNSYFPDSKKWATEPIDRCFRPMLTDYYDGEE